MKNVFLALLAALVGGIVGNMAFLWIAQHGFYALVLPGGLVGIGAGLFQHKSIPLCFTRAAWETKLGNGSAYLFFIGNAAIWGVFL